MITINYNSERDVKGNTYFKQYPDGGNIAALWKEFGSIRIDHDDNVQSIIFRLFDMKDANKIDLIFLQAPLYFKSYNVTIKEGVPKSITITPKEPIPFHLNTEGLTDTVTTRIVSDKEYERMRASTGFIN